MANDITIPSRARIIIFEGLYLSLDREPWRDAAGLMDELWFVNVSFETARRRLLQRHIASRIVRDRAHAERRIDESDLGINGRLIVDHRLPVDEVVESREDGAWALDRK